MRILIDARYLDGSFTGIATYSRFLVENLSRIDQENEYQILVRPGFGQALDIGDNFKLLTYGPAPVSLSTLTRLGRFIDSLRVDLVHSLFPLAPLYMRTPLMVTVHDLQPFIDPEFSGQRPLPIQMAFNLFYRNVYPATLARAKWVINDSYHTRDNVAEYFPTTVPKLVVVTPGLDQQLLDPPRISPDEVVQRLGLTRPYAIYYGSTRPNKNLPNLVRAFAAYIRRTNDLVTDLLMVLKKDRFFKEIARQIKLEGIDDRVRVLGQLPGEDQRAVLSRARAMFYVTRYEGFGFPALEAMAAGVPVLAGKSGSLPEVCGDAADFAVTEDIDDIAAGMQRVLGDASLRARLIERGLVRARMFDWKESAEKVRDIYRLLF